MEKVSIKKEQIVNAARDLFTSYGYKRVSMDEIARESNVVKRTIYKYFKDKDELLKYFITEEIEKMKQLVDKIEKESESTFEMIHRTIYELLKYRNSQKILITISKEAESLHTKSVCESVKMIDKSIMSYIENKLNKGIEKGLIKKCNSKLMSFALFKLYFAIAFEWNEEINEKEIAENVGLFLKTGLLN